MADIKSEAPSEQVNNLAPEERVLSTLNDDGSRRWLNPRPANGKFLTARRMVAYLLIVIFSAVPWIQMNSKPMILLDVMHREFVFFGKTFLPTDTLLLALLLIILFVAVFLVTALFGRIWCGWTCPQTVYMEFLYRPVERLFMGTPGKGKPKSMLGLRKGLQYVVYLVISFHLAQTFLSYFVGAEQLSDWIIGPPSDHPVAFVIVIVTAGLMMFDFAYFREQVCCVMCPYARMQSALLDKDSLIITYDKNRGEPRGKKRRSQTSQSQEGVAGDVVSLPVLGDCIDCTMCVQTCPTGIDIRDGVQLECIGCAQCVDACNVVMEKIGRPLGLIRYSSERVIDGEKAQLIRPRIIIYPLILLGAIGAFLFLLATKPVADVEFIRGQGLPFNILESDMISNQVRITIANRTEQTETYSVVVIDPPGVRINEFEPMTVEPVEMSTQNMLFLAPFSLFEDGEVVLTMKITGESGGFETIETYKILGPMSLPKD